MILRTLVVCSALMSQFGLEAQEFTYDLGEPTHTIELDEDLAEISGIALTADERAFLAVQDEKGKIYRLDKKTGEVLAVFDFWKDGDYEDVEIVGDLVYVLKSSGTLYQIERLGMEDQEVTKYNNALEKQHDTEGLSYDAANNRLLIACKGWSGEEHDHKDVYAFDLNKKELLPHPILTIKQAQMAVFINANPDLDRWEKLSTIYDGSKEHFTFSPSAVALHPKTGCFYMLSSVGKVLLVTTPRGEILHVQKMSKKIHAQPEGMCFDQAGTLFISNEAKDKIAMIHSFEMR